MRTSRIWRGSGTSANQQDRLGDYLAERRLEFERDLGAADYRSRHYGPPAAAIRRHEFHRVAVARVR